MKLFEDFRRIGGMFVADFAAGAKKKPRKEVYGQAWYENYAASEANENARLAKMSIGERLNEANSRPMHISRESTLRSRRNAPGTRPIRNGWGKRATRLLGGHNGRRNWEFKSKDDLKIIQERQSRFRLQNFPRPPQLVYASYGSDYQLITQT